jgi:hypothetical protein
MPCHRPRTRILFAFAILATGAGLRAEAPLDRPHVGEVYEIRRVVNSTWAGSGTGSAHDADIVVERVIAVSDAGEELEFDLPNDPSTDASDRDWKFPARVRRPPTGPLQLLNAPELEQRLNRWLRAARMTRQACGHWIFTWNAFQIECDPQSAVAVLEPFDRWPDDLREGAPYQEAESRAPVQLRETPGSGGAAFVARMEVDPEAMRRARARQDVVIAEIMRQSLTYEAALQARSPERISGTITTTFEVEAGRNVRRRTTVTDLDISGGPEPAEHRTINETVERRLVSARAPAR